MQWHRLVPTTVKKHAWPVQMLKPLVGRGSDPVPPPPPPHTHTHHTHYTHTHTHKLLTGLFGIKFGHFRGGELKVEDVDVLLEVLEGVHTGGERHVVLCDPPQSNLRRAFVVRLHPHNKQQRWVSAHVIGARHCMRMQKLGPKANTVKCRGRTTLPMAMQSGSPMRPPLPGTTGHTRNWTIN